MGRADIFGSVFQNNARPWSVWWLVFCIGIACLIPPTAPLAIPAAAGIVMAYIGFRSWDKKNAGLADVEKAKIGGGSDGSQG